MPLSLNASELNASESECILLMRLILNASESKCLWVCMPLSLNASESKCL